MRPWLAKPWICSGGNPVSENSSGGGGRRWWRLLRRRGRGGCHLRPHRARRGGGGGTERERDRDQPSQCPALQPAAMKRPQSSHATIMRPLPGKSNGGRGYVNERPQRSKRPIGSLSTGCAANRLDRRGGPHRRAPSAS